MVLHFIDEASKSHIARIIREGKVNNYSDLGNCDALDLIKIGRTLIGDPKARVRGAIFKTYRNL